MKTNQITIISITAILLFTLVGCEEPKGYLETKGPLPEPGTYDSGIRWTINGPVDEAGNPLVLEEVEFD